MKIMNEHIKTFIFGAIGILAVLGLLWLIRLNVIIKSVMFYLVASILAIILIYCVGKIIEGIIEEVI